MKIKKGIECGFDPALNAHSIVLDNPLRHHKSPRLA